MRCHFLTLVSLHINTELVLTLLCLRFQDISDLKSDSVGSAHLGISPPDKVQCVCIAVDGTNTSTWLVQWAIEHCLKDSDVVQVNFPPLLCISSLYHESS